MMTFRKDREDVALVCRFSDRAREAVRRYREFMEAGFDQGRREGLRGGGLVRSAGGVEAVLSRKGEEREAADPRILGGGDFVEELRERSESPKVGPAMDIGTVLSEVAESTGVSTGEIVGASRSRRAARARRLFYQRAQDEAGASASLLGRLAARSHTAVARALTEARRPGGEGQQQG